VTGQCGRETSGSPDDIRKGIRVPDVIVLAAVIPIFRPEPRYFSCHGLRKPVIFLKIAGGIWSMKIPRAGFSAAWANRA
jgi:hypothetical protein